jgi:hypothetical protein
MISRTASIYWKYESCLAVDAGLTLPIQVCPESLRARYTFYNILRFAKKKRRRGGGGCTGL